MTISLTLDIRHISSVTAVYYVQLQLHTHTHTYVPKIIKPRNALKNGLWSSSWPSITCRQFPISSSSLSSFISCERLNIHDKRDCIEDWDNTPYTRFCKEEDQNNSHFNRTLLRGFNPNISCQSVLTNQEYMSMTFGPLL